MAGSEEASKGKVTVALGMEINGYEVARRLRTLPDFQDTLLICMSDFGRKADLQQSRDAGFDHHLLKPTDPELLQRLLDAWKNHLSNRMNRVRKREGSVLGLSLTSGA